MQLVSEFSCIFNHICSPQRWPSGILWRLALTKAIQWPKTLRSPSTAAGEGWVHVWLSWDCFGWLKSLTVNLWTVSVPVEHSYFLIFLSHISIRKLKRSKLFLWNRFKIGRWVAMETVLLARSIFVISTINLEDNLVRHNFDFSRFFF